MNIQDALKETGKAKRSGELFAEVIEGSVNLKWSNGLGVSIQAILSDDWQPYHEVKEIRPENVGELWINNFGIKWFIHFMCTDQSLGLAATSEQKVCFNFDEIDIIYGKGWTRLYPPVEDESVERIEIEGVEWDTGDCTYPYQKGTGFDWDELINMKPMKLILEIPKETP